MSDSKLYFFPKPPLTEAGKAFERLHADRDEVSQRAGAAVARGRDAERAHGLARAELQAARAAADLGDEEAAKRVPVLLKEVERAAKALEELGDLAVRSDLARRSVMEADWAVERFASAHAAELFDELEALGAVMVEGRREAMRAALEAEQWFNGLRGAWVRLAAMLPGVGPDRDLRNIHDPVSSELRRLAEEEPRLPALVTEYWANYVIEPGGHLEQLLARGAVVADAA